MTPEEFQALREAVRAQHSTKGITTRAFCFCGSSQGGPAGTPACRALRAVNALALERDMLRDFLDEAVKAHQESCEVRRWSNKLGFGPRPICSCLQAGRLG